MFKNGFLFAFSLALALFLTGPKLFDMARVRGWIPGAQSRTVEVTDRWFENKKDSASMFGAWWISWEGGDIRSPGPHRINLRSAHWNRIKVGDTMRISYLPSSPIPYHSDGIFASNGNFALDIVLFALELFFAQRYFRRLRRDRENAEFATVRRFRKFDSPTNRD